MEQVMNQNLHTRVWLHN